MIYFVPDTGTMTKERAEGLGLGYAMDGEGPSYASTTQGPSGHAGVLFTFAGANLQRSHEATWEQIPGTDREVWVGFYADDPPGPSDLERKKALPGHEVELGDGRRWTVPVARMIDGSTPLPRKVCWNGSSWIHGDVSDLHRELFAQACRVWDALAGHRDGVATLDDECGIAAMALFTNYRLGPCEISILGLFTTETEVEVLKALVDWPALEEEPGVRRVVAAAWRAGALSYSPTVAELVSGG